MGSSKFQVSSCLTWNSKLGTQMVPEAHCGREQKRQVLLRVPAAESDCGCGSGHPGGIATGATDSPKGRTVRGELGSARRIRRCERMPFGRSTPRAEGGDGCR